MSGLVERLRQGPRLARIGDIDIGEFMCRAEEAADRIEALEAENEHLSRIIAEYEGRHANG